MAFGTTLAKKKKKNHYGHPERNECWLLERASELDSHDGFWP